MTEAELETLLNAAEERPNLEFKAAMPWGLKSLAKDILAMANTIDGGNIIVGVEDTTWIRQGVSADHLDTYDEPKMRDQIAPYADPHVTFRLFKPKDLAGMRFVAIVVSQFDDLPVICKKDFGDLTAGSIYHRTRVGKVQSARVSNSNDMREIVDAAAALRMKKFQQLGLKPVGNPANALNEELEGL